MAGKKEALATFSQSLVAFVQSNPVRGGPGDA